MTLCQRWDTWDPIWQPLFKLSEDSFLVSPSLITGSSAERNLITLLNKIPRTRQIYHQLSLEKENEQLSELKKLFAADRFASRSRLNVKRKDGSTLSDADLILFDKQEGFALIVQVKWLIRPDYVTEVAARDQEIAKALKTTRDVVDRVRELGSGWLERVVEHVPTNALMRIEGLLVNRDFLPSGWVNDEDVPVVDMAFLENFINSDGFTGLHSLYHAALRFDKTLISQHAAKDTTIVIALGGYTFECPGMEPLDNESGYGKSGF